MRVTGRSTARSLPCVRKPVDDRPAGISQAEQPGDLVVGLAGRVIARATQQLVRARSTARDRDWCGRPRRPGPPPAAAARRCGGRATRYGRPGGARARAGCRATAASDLANDTPTSSEPTRPGPCVTAMASDRVERDLRLFERPLDDAADVAHVLARGQLGHDAAPLAMDLGLRRHDIGADAPRVRRLAGLLDQRGRGLVAGGLDPEEQHRLQIAD